MPAARIGSVGVVAPGTGFAGERQRHAGLDGQPGAVEPAGPRIADREAAEWGRCCIADDHPALVDLVAGRRIEVLHGHRELARSS